MRKFFFIIILFILSFTSFEQTFSGLWKGVFYSNGTSKEKGNLIYLKINEDKDKNLSGNIREEVYKTEDFVLKQIKLNSTENNNLQIYETIISKKATGSKTNWCKMNIELIYDSITGYSSGTYSSKECKNFIGKLILFKSDEPISLENLDSKQQFWFEIFLNDLKNGLNAPEIRKIERKNFVFYPIYFDYDKDEIKPEFYDFLNKLIQIVKGHSDLRIKVTGHTDSDGSDNYNFNLSEKRAKAIISYFESKGLSSDRLEFDFKGEKNPVDTNNTPEGRQKNRRVNFEFI